MSYSNKIPTSVIDGLDIDLQNINSSINAVDEDLQNVKSELDKIPFTISEASKDSEGFPNYVATNSAGSKFTFNGAIKYIRPDGEVRSYGDIVNINTNYGYIMAIEGVAEVVPNVLVQVAEPFGNPVPYTQPVLTSDGTFGTPGELSVRGYEFPSYSPDGGPAPSMQYPYYPFRANGGTYMQDDDKPYDIDFGQNLDVASLTITNGTGGRHLWNYSLHTSTDGSNWFKLLEAVGNINDSETWDMPVNAKTRYLRIVCERNFDLYWFEINKIIINATGSDLAPGTIWYNLLTSAAKKFDGFGWSNYNGVPLADYSKNAVQPTFTSNTTNGYTVQYWENTPTNLYTLLNGTSRFVLSSTVWENTSALEIHCPEDNYIDSYIIKAPSTGNLSYPISWSVESLNEETGQWTGAVDSQNSQVFTAGEEKTFYPDGQQYKFTKYRIRFTEGYGTDCALDKISFVFKNPLLTNYQYKTWLNANPELASNPSQGIVAGSTNLIQGVQTYKLLNNTVFKLPAVTPNQYGEVKVILEVPVDSAFTVDWGTHTFFNDITPDITAPGSYHVYWDYNPLTNTWVCGALKEGV